MKCVSKKRELCLVKTPTDRIVDEQRRIRVIPGTRVEFFNGIYETHDPEIMEFLRSHPYRGRKFQIVDDKAKITPGNAVPIAQGMLKTTNRVIDGFMENDKELEPIKGVTIEEVTTRPTDTTAISPELVNLIDERIHKALGTIIDLLKKDEVKEVKAEEKKEKVIEGKPMKTFSCPYCKEPFKSGIQVGAHKKVCEKRPAGK